jgi:hypothetical protein
MIPQAYFELGVFGHILNGLLIASNVGGRLPNWTVSGQMQGCSIAATYLK